MNKNQRGFTLLEILLATAIAGLIAAAITSAILQVVMGNARGSNHMTAVRQVQNAGYWFSHDAQMAQTVKLERDADGFPLTLSWIDWDGTVNVVTYNITGSELKRQYGTSTTTAAKFVVADSTKTKCRLSGGGTFNLTDSSDAFTISGGALADNGRITVATGSVLVTTAGGATINGASTWTGTAGKSAPWTTLAGGGTVVVSRAGTVAATGTWTSTSASATVAITTDNDGDAVITGSALAFTVTTAVGTGSQQQTETRVYNVTPRPSSR